MARSLLRAASGSWAMCQNSERALKCGRSFSCGLLALLEPNPWHGDALTRRGLAQAASLDSAGPPAPPGPREPAPGHSRGPRNHPIPIKEWLPKFHEACREFPDSTHAILMLRSVHHYRKEAVLDYAIEIAPGVMRLVNFSVDPAIVHVPHAPESPDQKHQAPDEGEAAASSASETTNEATNSVPASLRSSRLDIRHMLLLLNNLSRVTKKHQSLRRALGPQYRYSVEVLLKVAAKDERLYSSPAYVGQFATALARLNLNSRPFWRNLHEGLLPHWDARSAAAVIHAYGWFHRETGAGSASEGAQKGADTHGKDSEEAETAAPAVPPQLDVAEMSAAPSAHAEEHSGLQAADGAHSDDPGISEDSYESAKAAFGAGREPQKDKMRRLQLQIVERFIDDFNAHGVEICVLSLGKQGMLHGRALELLQGALRRTAPDLVPDQLAVVLYLFYRTGTPLGGAEPIMRERALDSRGVIPKMHMVHAMRCLQIFRAWGWPHQPTQEWCLDRIRQPASRLTVTESAKALAILAELEQPLEKAHSGLIRRIAKGGTKMPGDVLKDAKMGLEWVVQSAPSEAAEGSASGIDMELVASTLANVNSTLERIERMYAARRGQEEAEGADRVQQAIDW